MKPSPEEQERIIEAEALSKQYQQEIQLLHPATLRLTAP